MEFSLDKYLIDDEKPTQKKTQKASGKASTEKTKVEVKRTTDEKKERTKNLVKIWKQ